MADKRVIEQTASTELYNDDWFLKDSVVEGTTKISAAKLKELLGADGTQALEEIANAIAEEYDSTHTYSLNSWVFHEGVLYRCISQSTTGTWDATKWQAKTIKEFIDTAKNSVLSTIEQMLGEYLPISTLDPPSIEAISKGDIFIYQRTNKYKFYRAKADHPQGVTEFDIDDWDEFDTVSDLIEDVTEKIAEIEIPVKDVQVKTDSTYDSVVDASGNAKIDLSSMTAYGEVPNLPQAIATFKDGADAPMKSLKVAIEPVQDLHGYDAPWVGGAGKNKLQVKATSQTIGGVTFTINNDGTINVNGTATQNITLELSRKNKNGTPLPQGDLIMNGCPSGGSTSSYYLTCWRTNGGNANDVGEGRQFSYQSDWDFVVSLVILSGTTCNNLTFKPMIRLASVADATFAPYSNICPISGWDEVDVTRTGKNLFDATNLINDRTIDTNGDLSGYGGRVATPNYIPVKPNTSICLSYSKTVSQNVVFIYALYKDGTLISRVANNPMGTAIQTENANQIRFAFYDSVSASDLYNIQLEYGNTATSYEPYNPNSETITIQLGDTYYGGKLDVASGVLTVDRAYVTYDGSSDESWGYSAGWSKTNTSAFYLPGDATIKFSSWDDYPISKCNCLTPMTRNELYDADTTGIGMSGSLDGGNVSIRVPKAVSDVSELRTWLSSNNVQAVYELATPQTIQLTPTQVKSLLGVNNIWADTGDINDCIYRRDMSSTIDDIIARLETLEG